MLYLSLVAFFKKSHRKSQSRQVGNTVCKHLMLYFNSERSSGCNYTLSIQYNKMPELIEPELHANSYDHQP